MCSSETQRTVPLSSSDAEYVELSACSQKVKFVSMLLGRNDQITKAFCYIRG